VSSQSVILFDHTVRHCRFITLLVMMTVMMVMMR